MSHTGSAFSRIVNRPFFSRLSQGPPTVSARQRKIRQTEESALTQLPDDIFRFDARALDRAASFGLVPMREGWIAGGLIGKLIRIRMRSPQQAQANDAIACSDRAASRLKELSAVDPSMPASELLRLRADLVKRGVIT